MFWATFAWKHVAWGQGYNLFKQIEKNADF